MKKIKILVLGVLIVMILAACGKEEVDLTTGVVDGIKYEETESVTTNIKIEMNNQDLILLELYPDSAPLTVENFQKLVKDKFYDGTKFHRVMENFMIQAGRSAHGKTAESIKGEFLNNGVDNYVLHEKGVISMARRGDDMDSASSEFFIMHKKDTFLDRDYATFGKVIAGMSTVDKIAKTPVDKSDPNFPVPLTDQVIKSIRFINIIED